MDRAATWSFAALLVLTAACAPSTGDLQQLFSDYSDHQRSESPLRDTSAEDRDPTAPLLATVTPSDHERRAEAARGFLARLNAIDRATLEGQDVISYDMLKRDLEDDIRAFELRTYRIPLTVDDGFHIGFARLPARHAFGSVADYELYIDRLDAFPAYVDDNIGLMREGLETGWTLAQVILDGYEVTIETHIVDDPTASVFWPPFENFPTSVPRQEFDRLRGDGRRAITESVVAGYQTFLEFMLDEYVPGARTTIGASDMPDGRAYYDHQIEVYTTLDDLGAEQIHEIGLGEVARIRAEMETVMQEADFQGDFGDFLDFLRTDPQFYASTPADLLREAAFIAKEMDGKLPTLFKTLPRLPYGIQPVPEHLAPKYTAGRYIGASIGGTQPGYYWVNTYALESRPLYALPALTLHEAVPGHHIQNGLRQELEGLPEFRRFSSNSAFGEGWGLYSEFLGIEAGIYKTPYQHFGRLTYEMWRACRLVVDTGMHAMGWTRQQTLDFLAENTALSLHEIRTETDRYISWPGQALAYKLGELRIRALRSEAEEALGESFDVRDFHDVVLRNGAVPLTVLEDQVHRWIASEVEDQ